ncbi:uncharacterized protein LOC111429737 isoform X2 [Cucurbita moschata]|uniref:Uncharacterized protein LOC111429737 isoform X2 n=1 Tax=Cucurbita moschata TaxID=3662 RepID=A0A6J1E0K6_CUCMO|nr:uncharacterized protein LOC111429737 isoform X2 [Cucurbita moschata]
MVSSVMEPSQMFGVSEECHSSESGWTMYIGSPAAADGSSDVDTGAASDEEEDEEHKGYYDINQDDSDDSMASDASSGPSHQQRRHPFGGMKNPPHALLPLFTHQNKPNSCFETKPKPKPKPKKPLKKKQRAERKEVKEPKSSVQSSSKARKCIWMGKRN